MLAGTCQQIIGYTTCLFFSNCFECWITCARDTILSLICDSLFYSFINQLLVCPGWPLGLALCCWHITVIDMLNNTRRKLLTICINTYCVCIELKTKLYVIFTITLFECFKCLILAISANKRE